MNPIVLGPSWQLRPVDRFNQGFYPLDDDAWLEQDLPAHWQEHPRLYDHTGKVVYRTTFAPPARTGEAGPKRRWWLRADGIFYWSRFFLNGRAFPRHEGYFAPQEHEVTGAFQAENNVVLEVSCPEERHKLGKRMITGVFSHWDAIDPATNPGGVWLPITLEESGVVRLRRAQITTRHIKGSTATLRWSADLDSLAMVDVELRWSLVPATFEGEPITWEERHTIGGGIEQLTGSKEIPNPHLWWTHDLGRPDLYEATLEIRVFGEVSDTTSFRFGIRTFAMRDFQAYLNGERFLIKGNNYAPGDTRIARMTPNLARRDVDLARTCNMNLLRVHAHVDHPAFYDAADEAGLLLWQDFPLQWLYRRSVLPEARRQARQMVELLDNHPSVAIWCMHNEPVFMIDTSDTSISSGLRVYYSVFFWNWNREVMDRRLQRDMHMLDPTRPTVSNSGEFTVPGWLQGTDAHLYYGWYPAFGKLRGFDWLRERFPHNIRFVSEFGAQSFPNRESCEQFMAPDIEKIDWPALEQHHSFQGAIMAHWYDWQACRSLDELVEVSQRYQCEVNRFFIDRLRLSKYNPTGGIVPFMFNDSNPAVQWSILDYWRVPKASYAAMRDAFSPQYAWTLLDSDEYATDEELTLPIYVVNDAREPVDYMLDARIVDANGTLCASATAAGQLARDCLPGVAATVAWTPERAGDYKLRIELSNDGKSLANVYDILVRGDDTG